MIQRASTGASLTRIFHEPMVAVIPTPADRARRMQRLYALQAPIYDWTRWAILAGRRRALVRLDPQPGDRILDLGCGTGKSLPSLSRAVGAAGSICGLDCSAAMLHRARARCRNDSGIALVCGDILDLAGMAGLGRFDKVLLSYSLTLIPTWQRVLAACLDLLAPGGRIVVVDFLDCPTRGLQHLFRAHCIEFGSQRRAWLRQNFRARSDEQHPAYLGAWSWFLFSGDKFASTQ